MADDSQNIQPPKLGIVLLEILLSKSEAESMIGCLVEDWAKVIRANSTLKAKIWFWSEVLRSIWWMLPKAISDCSKGLPLSYIATSSALYALLYVIALLMEVAYQFDRLGPPALKRAPWIFLWVFGATAVGLWADWIWTLRGKRGGLVLSLLTFITASLLIYTASRQFLPHYPVTETDFQMYPAHVAFLKSVNYFLLLAVVFIVLPYHFVLSIQRDLREGRHCHVLALLTGRRPIAAPAGAVYLKVWWLAFLLIVAAVAALLAMAHLFESLKPKPHMGLFVQLAQWRFLLYFILGLECVVWYYCVLNGIKRKCLEAASAGRSPVTDRET
jgi:hypothetical protein